MQEAVAGLKPGGPRIVRSMKGPEKFAIFLERLQRERFFWIAGALLGVLLVSSVSVYNLEHGRPDSDIRGIGDAIWWSFVTIASVGYGDVVPKTAWGRVMGVVTMLSGIVLFSITTATIASVFVEKKIREERGLEATKLKGHVVLCGWNPATEETIDGLIKESAGPRLRVVLVNELAPEDVDALRQKFEGHDLEWVRGNFVYENVLRRANIASAAVVIVVPDASGGRTLDRADERTILATLAIKSLAPKTRTCAELLDGSNRPHLLRANVDEIIVRGERTGILLGSVAICPGLTDVLDGIFSLEAENGMWRMEIPEQFVGRPVGELAQHLRKERQALLVALVREQKGIDLTDLLSHDMSAVDAFIRRKFEEADISLRQKKSGYGVTVNPPEDYLIDAQDAAFVLGPRGSR
jgi:voltage-gated potassium channel